MSDTDDRNDAHQGRVARIILLLHPAPSLALIAAALTHDDGEFKSGDLSGDTKRENPELREMIRVIEKRGQREIWLKSYTEYLNISDAEWLKFADSLDAFMWMMHNRPHLNALEEWQDQRNELREFSETHGLHLEGVI